MRFIKFHGYGNDYLVFEAAELVGVAALGEFARRVCERHYGAGADGIAVIGEAEDESADYSVRIFNPDGSEAAMSGNGVRCAAAYLFYQELWWQDELRFATRAGIKRYRLREGSTKQKLRFEAEIGKPAFESRAIPLLTDAPLARVVGYRLAVGRDETIPVTALLMCNPNCCVFADDFDALDWRRIGKAIESHPQFPERTNVEFIRVRDRATIEARVWERGVGETESSGTGACAAAVAACVNGLTDRRVTVLMPGGRLEVEWRGDDEVLLTGEAEPIYSGEWLKE